MSQRIIDATVVTPDASTQAPVSTVLGGARVDGRVYLGPADTERAGLVTPAMAQTLADVAAAYLQGGTIEFAFPEAWGDPSESVAMTWVSDRAIAQDLSFRVNGSSDPFATVPVIRSRRLDPLRIYFHTAVLDGLSPDTIYEFEVAGFSDTVKTARVSEPKVSVISDYQQFNFGAGSQLQQIGANVTATEPDILVLNGDFINDDGLFGQVIAQLYLGFLRGVAQNYRTRDGALVPLVALVGNHEGRNDAYGAAGAFYGGDGTIGYTKDVFSFGYMPESPRRFADSAMSARIGNELLIVCLNTDHTVPMAGQLGWFTELLAAEADEVAHVLIVGHVGPFTTYSNNVFRRSSQGRVLRNFFVTVAQQYPNLRLWMEGHSHRLEIKKRLRMNYDPSFTITAPGNDQRWTDDPTGIRYLGSGPWGASRRDLTDQFQTLQSEIDGSTLMEASLYFRDNSHQVLGSIMSPSDNDIWHGWELEFLSGEVRATARGRSGAALYEITDPIPGASP